MKIELMKKDGGNWCNLPANYLAGKTFDEWLGSLEGTEIVARIHIGDKQVAIGGTVELREKLAKKYKWVLGFEEMRERLLAKGSTLLEVTIPEAVLEVFPGAELLEVNDDNTGWEGENNEQGKSKFNGNEGLPSRVKPTLREHWHQRASEEA